MWPSLREFLRIPDELTGKDVRIAVIDGEYPRHPDICTNERRTSYLVPGMSEPDAPPEVFTAERGPWKGGWHALCAAAVGRGIGRRIGRAIHWRAAPEADLFSCGQVLHASRAGTEEEAQIRALEWVRANWRKYEIRGVLSSRKGVR